MKRKRILPMVLFPAIALGCALLGSPSDTNPIPNRVHGIPSDSLPGSSQTVVPYQNEQVLDSFYYAILRNDLWLRTATGDSVLVESGVLVHVVEYSTRYGAWRRLYIIESTRLRSTSHFTEADLEPVDDARRDSLAAIIFGDVNVMGVVVRDRNHSHSIYMGTLLPDGRLINYAANSDFSFLGDLLFRRGQVLHIYEEAAFSTVATVKGTHPTGCFGIGGPVLEHIAWKEEGQSVLFSTQRLELPAQTTTPAYDTLMHREKNLTGIEELRYDYRLMGVLDLDRDGINELIFQDIGWESTSFSIYKYVDDTWERIYQGGGFSC